MCLNVTHLTCTHVLKIALSIKVLCFLHVLPRLRELYLKATAKATTFSGVLELFPVLAPSSLGVIRSPHYC